MEAQFVEAIAFIITTVLVMIVLTGMNRVSGQLNNVAAIQTRAWQFSSCLIIAGRWMVVASAGLIAPFALISLPLNALFPDIDLPVLSTAIPYLVVTGGVILAVSTFVITGNFIWRIILRWGARALLRRFQQAIQAWLTVQQPKHLLKFFGQVCFAVCAATLQLLGRLFLIMIRAGFGAEPEEFISEEADYMKEGADYDFYHGTNIYNSFHD